ncbi:MAG: PAS domain S-box protein [Candidatus Nealsonbacteria bacterium]|nr:PAS domain S-box protein [Candidatus Nealsonbacteria bacterium]
MPADEDDVKSSLLADDLASLENYIHDLFNFSPLPIAFVSPIGVLLEVNPAFESISQLKSYELIGEPIEKLFEKEEIDALAQQTLEEGSVKGREMKFFPKKGEEAIITQVFSRVRQDEKGEAVGYFLGLFDLSNIKQVERELKKSQTALMNILDDTEKAREQAEEERKRTEEIIASLNDGIFVFDKDRRLSLMNPQAEEFFGVDKEELAGKKVFKFFHYPELRPLANLLGRKIERLFREELKLEENFILEVSTIPLTRKGKNMGYVVVLHDVSREKVVERMKTEFVSIAAHQLRTPLSAIKWTLKMLLEGDLGGLTDEQKEYVNKTYVSNERMIRLINDLLNVTRIEEGRYVYDRVSVDLVEMLESLVSSYEDDVKNRGIKLVVNKPEEELPKIKADPEKIRLASQNLVENAIKYTLEGGKVTVTIRNIGNEAEVAVSDTGIGIPEEQQDRVFGKFFRGANALKEETEGSGLGLFITKNIIEAHGGSVWFESEAGKGTTFYFTIPFPR